MCPIGAPAWSSSTPRSSPWGHGCSVPGHITLCSSLFWSAIWTIALPIPRFPNTNRANPTEQRANWAPLGWAVHIPGSEIEEAWNLQRKTYKLATFTMKNRRNLRFHQGQSKMRESSSHLTCWTTALNPRRCQQIQFHCGSRRWQCATYRFWARWGVWRRQGAKGARITNCWIDRRDWQRWSCYDWERRLTTPENWEIIGFSMPPALLDITIPAKVEAKSLCPRASRKPTIGRAVGWEGHRVPLQLT